MAKNPAHLEVSMSIEPARSLVRTFIGAVLLLLAFFCWIGFVMCAVSMHESDAAGNGMAQGFAFVLGIAEWILLAMVLLVAGFGGKMPAWGKISAFILVPGSCAASLAAVQMLAENEYAGQWLFGVPILLPLLIAGYALWALIPRLRAAVSPNIAGGVVWCAVAVLSALPWPLIIQHSLARDEEQKEVSRVAEIEEALRIAKDREEWSARFKMLPPDAPLWQWREFTEHGEELRKMALEGIRRLERRQTDAEILLEKGYDFPMRELPGLGLEATPALCENARKFLRERVKRISPPVPGRPYSWEKDSIDPYISGIEWLVRHDCDCRGELAQIEAAVQAYPKAADRNQTLAALARISQIR